MSPLPFSKSSFRVLLAFADFRGNSFFLFPLAYLSTYLYASLPFRPSLSIRETIYPWSLSLRWYTFALPFLSFSLASCANVSKSVYDITTRSCATPPPSEAESLLRLLFPATLTTRYPRQFLTDTTNFVASAVTADGAMSCVTTADYHEERIFSRTTPTPWISNFLIITSRL